jgi:hypothetical protein
MCLKGTAALQVLLGKANNIRLVEALTDADVEFVIIGGVALAYHGFRDPADVDDLDLLLEPNEKTVERITITLSGMQPPVSFVKSKMRAGSKLMLKNNFYAELIFAEGIERAPEIITGGTLVALGGTTIRLATVGHLRTMKERVVKIFRDSLGTPEGASIEFQNKLETHERDLVALRKCCL